MRFPLTLFLVTSGVFSSRFVRKTRTIIDSKKSRAVELYTFGAPKVTFNLQKWPREGCFTGLRAEAEDYRSDKENIKDVVTWLMASYRHPEMKVLRLFENNSRSRVEKCGWYRGRDSDAQQIDPVVFLHFVYEPRSVAFGGRIATMASVGLNISYETKPNLAGIRSKGWRLVTSAVENKVEVSHLLQNPDTLECMLTFEGTDQVSEWFDNINIMWTTFCGFGFIHAGFRDVLMRMASSSIFNSAVRPHLGKCSKIDVVGHSLGGAIATLWTGCILNGNSDSPDYNQLKFTWETPQLLPFKEDFRMTALTHASGSCVHPYGGEDFPNDDTALVYWKGCPFSVWRTSPAGEKGWYVLYHSGDKCVHPEGGSETPGQDTTLVLHGNCAAHNKALWFKPICSEKKGYYSLQHYGGKCVHPRGGAADPGDGTALVLWDGCSSSDTKMLVTGLEFADGPHCA